MAEDDAIIHDIQKRLADLERRVSELEDAVYEEEGEGEEA